MIINGLNLNTFNDGYILVEQYEFDSDVIGFEYSDDLVSVDLFGHVVVNKGFISDGATNALDTLDFAVGFFRHDVGYYLIRKGAFPADARKEVDKQLRKDCKTHGMPWFRRWYIYRAVRMFGWACV